jgi:hypothetical protein
VIYLGFTRMTRWLRGGAQPQLSLPANATPIGAAKKRRAAG